MDILLSTYNGESFLKELINSIISQTYKEWKLIIRDDGSSDNTELIIRDYIKAYPGKIVFVDSENKENLGSAKSFLKLLNYSNDELILFCDQDDVWKEDKLQIFNNFYNSIQNNTEKPILVFSSVTVVDSNLNELKNATTIFNHNKGKNNENLIWNILQNDVTGCAMMINKRLKEIYLSQRVPFVIHHDWFLSLLATAVKGKYYISSETILYRQHENNVVGAKKTSVGKTFVDLLNKKRKYPYYEQTKSLLLFESIIPDKDIINSLKDFSELNKHNKLFRIFWHIKNGFLRKGSLINKLYQLFIC